MKIIEKTVLATDTYILHIGGARKHMLQEYYTQYYADKPITVHEDISIATIAKYCYTPILVKQLKANNIAYLDGTEYFTGKMTDKLIAYKHLLEQSTTKYTLLLDAADIILLRDIDAEFIEKFKKYNSDIVFSRDNICWPMKGLRCDKRLLQLGGGLNAGIIFGETKKLLEIFKIFCDFMQTWFDSPAVTPLYRSPRDIISDQFWIRLYLSSCTPDFTWTIDYNLDLSFTNMSPELLPDRFIHTKYAIYDTDPVMDADIDKLKKIDI